MVRDRKRLLILGGSTRAAARSAALAGFQPVCADLFADLDTRRIAEIVPVRDYPHSLPDDVAGIRTDGWLFTGALENHPDLIERLTEQSIQLGPLLGSSAGALRRVRDPFWVAGTLQSAGFRTLAVRSDSAPPLPDGAWLQKPIASGGGRSIRIWNSTAESAAFGERAYYQTFVSGDPMSAAFWCDGDMCALLGITHQLIGSPPLHAPEPFSYCGSVGPVELSPLLVSELCKLGRELAAASGVRGLFGIDFVKSNETLWFVEMNPRYTASMEVLERVLHNSLFRNYRIWMSGRTADGSGLGVVRPGSIDLPHRDPDVSPGGIVAKLIIYAHRRIFIADFEQFPSSCPSDFAVELADIPLPGTSIEQGWPICSILTRGPSVSTALDRGFRSAQRLNEWLDVSTAGR